MVRPRRTIPVNPPEPNLATVVANLQRQLLEQQQETDRFREQLARMIQRPQVNEVPPQDNRVSPVITPVPDVQPEVQLEVPRNAEVSIAPVGVQVNPPPTWEDLLYERFKRMKAPEFEGPTDPIAADNWQIDIQVILDFMRLTEQKKVLCASFALKKDARHRWMIVQLRRDVTTMSWQDFVMEFRTIKSQKDDEDVRTDIAKQVSAGSSPPTLVSDCVSRAIRAEYWINQDKEAKTQIFKAKKEEKAVIKQMQPRQSSESNQKGRTSSPAQSSKPFGRNKREGNFTGQGQQRNYPQKKNNRGNEARLEGPSITQGRLEAPKPQARIYAYTKGDAEARTSHVVTEVRKRCG
ncbi:hypothetical protein TIFTF001_043534 [Ficus carica]|uniref:Gag protein n=1 Tax=Ficus carica TaxID=3494 RepID=A0AA87ZD69_FICCA|nr:hypothetical protein TIFTF001_043532 [Ficus carica]GMN22536.1 hypothetical protein TIFTF001_043534 [Ficus carica]